MTDPSVAERVPPAPRPGSADDQRPFVGSQLRLIDEWLEANIEEFDPFSAATPKGRYARRKAFAELAIYAYVRNNDPHSNRPNAVLDGIARHVNSDSFRALILRHPKQFLLYSSPVVCTQDAGHLSPETAAAVERTLRREAVWATERVPHRMLDLWNFCAAYGYTPHRLELPQIVDHGIVGRLDPIESSLRDAYGWTHHMLFAHNFGIATPAVTCTPLPYDEQLAVLLTLCRYMAEDNTDVALELVYGLALQRQLDDVTRDVFLDWLGRKAADFDGIVPGPISEEDAATDLPEEIDSDWYTHYHTRLVAASALRYARFYWSRPAPDPIDPTIGVDDLIACGEPLAALARYELPLGVAKAMDLAERGGALAQSALDVVRGFLAHHCAGAQLGFWVDERAQHDSVHGPGAFDETILEPMDALIGGWVRELTSTRDAPTG